MLMVREDSSPGLSRPCITPDFLVDRNVKSLACTTSGFHMFQNGLQQPVWGEMVGPEEMEEDHRPVRGRTIRT